MGVKRFFDKEVTVRRLKAVSGNKKAFQCTATADCHIQAMDRQARAEIGIVEGKAWIAYFSADDGDYTPKENDKITDSEGNIYKIIDVTKKDYSFGINQHIEVLMVEYNS